MKSYQDLVKVGTSDVARGTFCVDAVNEFLSTAEYKAAKVGQSYYDKHNTTIEQYKKFIYTLSGRKIEDIFSANYKLETNIFRRLVIQQVQYVLGNGMVLDDGDKDKLGKDFDFKLQKAAKIAMAQGKAFGFWNLDHLEVFGFADTDKEPGFRPLFDEDNGKIRAGIRFWFKNVDNEKIIRMTLYEEDGYTDYVKKGSEDPEVLNAKRAYIITESRTEIGGVEDIFCENYATFPIVVLYASDTQDTELSEGIRNKIDAYDFVESGLANTIDDTSGFFWLIKNSGGMDDPDLARFVQRIKTVKAAAVDSEEGGDAEVKTFDIPFEARKYLLEQLRKDIYEDFGALDVNTLSAAQKTTQEIQAAYQAQDNKCADFEYYVLDFVQKIMQLAAVEGNPKFNWNKVVNMNEQTNMLLSAAQYLPAEMIIKKLPFLTPEEAKLATEQNNASDFGRFNDNELTPQQMKILDMLSGMGDNGVDLVKEFIEKQKNGDE